MASVRGEFVAGDGRQQISEPFDAERQVARPQVDASGRMSNNNPFQRLANRCMSSLRESAKMQGVHGRLEDRMEGAHHRTSAPFSTGLERPSAVDASLYQKAGQCCFLCLKQRDDQVAVIVPCFRPVEARQVRRTRQRLESPTRKIEYRDIGPKARVRESDAAIFERLKWTCFKYQGACKQWMPYYGITKVQEVIVSFVLV